MTFCILRLTYYNRNCYIVTVSGLCDSLIERWIKGLINFPYIVSVPTLCTGFFLNQISPIQKPLAIILRFQPKQNFPSVYNLKKKLQVKLWTLEKWKRSMKQLKAVKGEFQFFLKRKRKISNRFFYFPIKWNHLSNEAVKV